MANFSSIHNINLQMCCVNTIDRINQRLKLGNIIAASLGPALWLNIFGPSPSTLNTIVAVQQTDFNTLKTLVEATNSISSISREVACKDCYNEWYKHIGNNKLEKFWRGMIDVFS